MLLSAAAATFGVFVISFIIFHYIQTVQNGPYMDEIFHVRQAQVFCSNNFSHWDPMITTLPGLYLSSLCMLFPSSLIVGLANFASVCSTYNLRAGNLIYCCGNFVLLFLLTRLLYLKSQSRRGPSCHLLLNAIVMTSFPVLYFFTWLYYTDPGAVFYTLLMYFLCLRGNHSLASASGIISILFRQTNVIWVLFCLATSVSDVLEKRLKRNKKTRQNLPSMSDWQVFKSVLDLVFSRGFQEFLGVLNEIFMNTVFYLLILMGFVMFVFLNNGIVVGDRSNHQASLNFPQVFYFLAISTAFSFSHVIQPKRVYNCVKTVLQNPIKCVLFVTVCYMLIKHYTYEHKYTLSDNRHYTFYVWSKLFRRFTWARYAMIPVYLFSLINFYLLTIHKGVLWRLSVSACIVLCLVPQALLEFRYYIIPFYLIRLNMHLPSKTALVFELLVYTVINAFTIYMFTQRPFYWPNDPNPQRFMW